jgi:hypothetical protein
MRTVHAINGFATAAVMAIAICASTLLLLPASGEWLEEKWMSNLFGFMGASAYFYAMLSFFLWVLFEWTKSAAKQKHVARIQRNAKLLRYLMKSHKLHGFAMLAAMGSHIAYEWRAYTSETDDWVFYLGIAASAALIVAVVLPLQVKKRSLALKLHAWIGLVAVLLASMHTGGMVVVMASVVLAVLFLLDYAIRWDAASSANR